MYQKIVSVDSIREMMHTEILQNLLKGEGK